MPSTFPRFILLASIVCFQTEAWARGKAWQKLENCRLIQKAAHDGDSFHVKTGEGRHYIFRLYNVDAAETDREFPDRVAAQAKYFRLSEQESLEVGQEATRFVEQMLYQRTFTVWTKKQNARGRSKKKRYYAFIRMGGKDLGDELIANGLGRVYGYKSKAPDALPVGAQLSRLKRLEEIAKTQKVGAWGYHSGGLHKRVQTQEKIDAEAFDRFFHPEKFRSSSP